VVEREVVERPSVVSGAPVTLLGAEARDLRPNVGAVGDVMVLEAGGPAVPGELEVVIEEDPTELRVAESLEIHREEGNVGEDITEPVLVSELDAVQDARSVVEQEDVVALQVTVPVARPACSDAFGEQTSTSS
jgi:hypothetical protein